MIDLTQDEKSAIESTAERELESSNAEFAFQEPIWSELKPEIVNAVKQQTILRKYAFIVALGVILFTMFLEIVILNCVLRQNSTEVKVAIVVAPIISFTAIAITILIGFYQAKLVPWAELIKSTNN